MPPVALTPVTDTTRPVLERLWQLYLHDLSEFRGTMPDEHGLFKAGRLPGYLVDDEDHGAYLIGTGGTGGTVAGFALLRGLVHEPRTIGEFFVLRAVRRHRVGHDAAVTTLREHPGAWEIAFQEENPGAARFWRQVATDVAGTSWREERRPVPGKPEIPPDVWLMLQT
ncbi:MAG TPA: GNAT family N-acetyltransferase [Actinomycetes bacterium]|nr:GNAT family N-acetyltransferase [Actinomycetes bacterium]